MTKWPKPFRNAYSQNKATTRDVWVRNLLCKNEIAEIVDLLNEVEVRHRLSSGTLNGTSLCSRLKKCFPGYRPIRLVGFTKTPDRNWSLPWHQDRVIAVEDRVEVGGFTNWTCKSGIWHCEAPMTLLKRMLFLRVFLDDVTTDDGGMAYAVGSHVEGIVQQSQAEAVARRYRCEVETARAGDILALPMLTLHRSGSALSNRTRRVLRVDLSDVNLPAPLDWFD